MLLDDVVARTAPTALAREHTLPVLPALSRLFPERCLQRGTTVLVRGAGAASLALAVAAGPSQGGSWVATVGLPSLGLAASAEAGVAFERLAVIAEPPRAQWGSVVASLIGAFDVVLVAAPRRVTTADNRRLAARSRERGTVLVLVDLEHTTRTAATPPPRGKGLDADVVLTVAEATWEGVGEGHGYLHQRRATVEATGRRAFARPRRSDLLLPGPDGRVALVDEANPARFLVVETPPDGGAASTGERDIFSSEVAG